MKISAQIISLGNKKIKFIFLEKISEVKAGITTGDNSRYVFASSNVSNMYKTVNFDKVLLDQELDNIVQDESLRLKIAKNGISDNMFSNKTIIPYDKGGANDIESGRLSNYYSKSEFFIDWSTKNVREMKTLTVAQVRRRLDKKVTKKVWENVLGAALRNPMYYFKGGITFSQTGLYAPTFRVNQKSLFDSKGPTIFIKSEFEKFFSLEYLLGILCSKLLRYIFKKFIKETVDAQVDDMKKMLIPICEKSQKQEIEKLVKEIIKKQKEDPDYNYQDHEQIEIDKIVYEIFGLDQELIDEVETWYARRYPKLVRDQDSTLGAK